MTDFWTRKLAAFLHDPPEKAYDYSSRHVERAAVHAAAFGLDPDLQAEVKASDWQTSAADRFIFPSGAPGRKLGGLGFTHPFSGEPADFRYPAEENAVEWIADVTPSFAEVKDSRKRFWLAWRLWMMFAASHHRGQGRGAETLPYLPADTRIPDHSIWHHLSVTSALESAAQAGNGENAFLLFQLGPVQQFIAQARTTRDLWSGSYLLSWLMARAMQELAGELGPDCLVFPSLRGNPLYDFLCRDMLKEARHPESGNAWDSLGLDSQHSLILTPTLPNKFLAVVPAGYDPRRLASTIHETWKEISETCWELLKLDARMRPRWNHQVESTWQVTYQVWPWSDAETAIRELITIPGGAGSSIRQAWKAARAIPEAHRDRRCYPAQDGWAWSAHYQLAAYHHDACRRVRPFAAWQGEDGPVKDSYSGREEEVTDEAWRTKVKNRKDIAHLFRKENEHAGAATLIKRVWHKAYLADRMGLKGALRSFEPADAIAAAREAGETIDDALAGKPRYFSVIVMDGDDMGRWVSGDKAPPAGDLMTTAARAYFEEKAPGASAWLESPRHVSPSYHLQFSEALSNFSLYAVRRIVEYHGGQLMYAGGDDVMAMVPALYAVDCARGLDEAFRGSKELPSQYPGLFIPTVPGFIRLADPSPAEPAWPLLVPGPLAGLSGGISIGHYKEPLQDMVEAARSAEHRAKGLPGKHALGINLFKRSGEHIEWDAGMLSSGFPMLRLFQPLFRKHDDAEPVIPGSFPYRIAELLRPFGPETTVSDDILPVLRAEFQWSADQLRKKSELTPLIEAAGRYMEELKQQKRPLRDFYNLFLMEAFLARQMEE